MQLTPAHEHILLHALGVSRREGFTKEPFRNWYGPGGVDVIRCRELAEAGLMREGRRGTSEVCGPTYHVTEAGIAEAKLIASPVKLAPGRRRYLLWLRVGDAFPDLSFGEWLKAGYWKQEHGND